MNEMNSLSAGLRGSAVVPSHSDLWRLCRRHASGAAGCAAVTGAQLHCRVSEGTPRLEIETRMLCNHRLTTLSTYNDIWN